MRLLPLLFRGIFLAVYVTAVKSQYHVNSSDGVQLHRYGYTDGGRSTVTSLTSQCASDMRIYHRDLSNQEWWALNMADAWGRQGSGMISGNTKWLGAYRQCTRVSGADAINSDAKHIRGRHCVAQWDTNLLGEQAVGACVPESCQAEDARHLFLNGSYTDVTVPSRAEVWCITPRDITKDAAAIVGLCIIALFVATVISSSLLDYRRTKLKEAEKAAQKANQNVVKFTKHDNPAFSREDSVASTSSITSTDVVMQSHSGNASPEVIGEVKKNSYMLNEAAQPPKENRCYTNLKTIFYSFSLYKNVPRLLNTFSPPGAFTSLNGMRFLAMAWIVVGHLGYYGHRITTNESYMNRYEYEGVTERRLTHGALLQMHLGVEVFFILSGFLVTVSFLKDMKKIKGKVTPRYIAVFYLHRYWRLTPVYAILLMVWALYFNYLVQGPLKKPFFYEVDDCKEGWWANLLYINNIYTRKECMGWTWYLANDFQFYLVSPIFLVVFYKSNLAGYILTGLVLIGSLVGNLILNYTTQVTRTQDWYFDLYTKPWNRISPFIIGMIVGFVHYQTKFKVTLNWLEVVLGWLGAAACFVLSVYLPFTGECLDCWTWGPAATTIYGATFRQIFSLGVVWIIFACCTGYGGVVNHFLSWSFFVPLAKLCYVAYLFHPMLLYFVLKSSPVPLYLDDLTTMYLYGSTLLFSLAAAFGITLIFEVPMLGVEKVILPAKIKPKPK